MVHRRGTSVTGGSTLRRSLVALLHDSRGFRGVPRNLTKPDHFSSYGLTPEQDAHAKPSVSYFQQSATSAR